MSPARLLVYGFLSLALCNASADPEQDRQEWLKHYGQQFPQLKLADYADGVYAIDPIARESWLAIEEFPPYELALEAGEKLYRTPFRAGVSYADCLPDGGIGIAHTYPRWDSKRGEVVTLALSINLCRQAHGEPPLANGQGDLADLTAYLAYTSRGKTISIHIPENDPRALLAYNQGKSFYYQRRGQLNFACATCHIQNAGKQIRSEILSPSLGHTSNWPTYRLKWGELGTLHRRFAECLGQIRADSPPLQSIEFRNLEYFLSYMTNGVPMNAPSVRK